MTMEQSLYDAEVRRMRQRAAAVPIVSTVLGSCAVLVPVVAEVPVLPPTGLLMLLGWRLLRPELWPSWIGLPLGLADDLISGRPLGTAMVLWTIILLAIEAAEDRMAWRDWWEEWLFAAVSCGVATLGYWAVARFTGGGGPLRITAPVLIASILCFPLALRVCARLDEWRLRQ